MIQMKTSNKVQQEVGCCVFFKDSRNTHIHTKSGKAVSGGKKKHEGIYTGGSAGLFCDA